MHSPLIGFENKWVAVDLEGKKVFDSAKTLKELAQKISKVKEQVILKKVLPFDKAYAPFNAGY